MKIFLLIFMLGVFFGTPSLATPPSTVVLSYDQQTKILHVEAAHPSDRLLKHYLRRMVIMADGNQINEEAYTRQSLAKGFSVDIALDVKGGEHVVVDLFCNQGGQGHAEIDIPKEEEKKAEGKEDVKGNNIYAQ